MGRGSWFVVRRSLFVSRISRKKGVPLSRANLRIWSKKVLDSRFPILVTRREKRSKNFLEKSKFSKNYLRIWSFFRQAGQVRSA